jgi:hypothetical protein
MITLAVVMKPTHSATPAPATPKAFDNWVSIEAIYTERKTSRAPIRRP